MPVKRGNIVSVEYTGTFDDGTVFDTSVGAEPLEFQVGAHHVIEGFEKAVIGKEKGDEIKIRLTPDQAYGDYDNEALQDVPREQFPKDQEPEAGMCLHISTPDGQELAAWIKEVKKDMITLDFNHPMAGKILNFKMKIMDIQEGGEIKEGCSCDCDHCHEH